MAKTAEEMLGAFKEKDYTVRLTHALCKLVPFAPELSWYPDMTGALEQAAGSAGPRTLARAREIALAPDAAAVLKMARALDTADSGLSIYSGVKSAVALYKSKKGARAEALETDKQQATDAVLKGLGLSYMIYRLFPGGPTEKLERIRALPSGQALLFYYAAVEVGLPFADNALLKGGTLLSSLFERFGGDQAERLSAVAGADASQASGMMGKLMAPLETLVTKSASYLKPVADTAAKYMPGALGSADKVAGVVATGADMLPVYRYLVSRVVIEESLRRAVEEIGPENAAAAQLPEPAPRPAIAAAPAAVSPAAVSPAAAAIASAPKKKGGSMMAMMAMAAVLVLGCAGAGAAMVMMGGSSSSGPGASSGSGSSPDRSSSRGGGSSNKKSGGNKKPGRGR